MTAPTARGFGAASNQTDMIPAKTVSAPTRAVGDLLLVIAGSDTTTTAISFGATYTAGDVDEAGGSNRFAWGWRIATNDADDDTTFAATNNQDGVAVILAITTGTHGVTQLSDIIHPAAATGASGNANPPTSGTVASKDWLAVAIAVVDITAADASNITAAPTNYTTGAFISKSATSTTSVALGVGTRALSAATSEDPGTFTNTSGAWIAKTLLIPPPSPNVNVNVGTATCATTANNSSASVAPTTGTGAVTATGNNVEAWLTFAHAASTSTSITVTGLTNGVSYDFRVAAVNAIGTGPFTATSTDTPAAADQNVNVGTATLAATAYGPNVSRQIAVGTATCAATANDASLAVSPTPTTATAPAVGQDAAHAITSTIGTATAATTANDVTISTLSEVNVDVGTATLAATGYDAAHTIASTIGTATLAATGNDSSKAVTPTLGAGALAVTGYASSSSIASTIGTATGTVTANNVTVVAGPQFFATSISTNRRYLLDQNGDPWFMQGTTPQLMLVSGTATEIDDFFSDQQARGVNSCQVHLVCKVGFSGATANVDGHDPFGNMSTFASPDTNWWALADTMFDTAETYGFTVWADPVDNFGYGPTVAAMTTGQAFAYGQFLGARYASRPNIVWMFGNDYSSAQWDATDPNYLQILAGIRDQGDTHLATVWLLQGQGNENSWDNSNWDPDDGTGADMVLAYTYKTTYGAVEAAYAHTGATAPKPVFMGEASYENEANGGPGSTSNLSLRKFAWWTVTSGAFGHVFGQYPVEYFDSRDGGWQAVLNSTAAQHIAHVAELMTSFANWQDLVPDTGSAFATGGRGTHTVGGDYTTNDYATAALTADGTLGIAYFPTSRGSITFDTSTLGTVTAYWYDPTDASTSTESTPAAPTHPGTNTGGDADWVLVFEGTGSSGNVDVSVGTATLAAAANTLSLSVGSTPTTATLASTANNSAAAVASTIGTGLASTTANDVTISTSVNVNVNVGTATLAAMGFDSSSSVASAIGTATCVATGQNASHGISPTASTAVVTGTGNDSSSSVKPTLGTGTLATTAYQPTISTAVIHNVDVGVAVCTTTANDAKHTIASSIGTATVAVTAYGPNVSRFVAVGTATCAVTANNVTASIGAGPGCATAATTANTVAASILAGVGYALAVAQANNVLALIGALPTEEPEPVRYRSPGLIKYESPGAIRFREPPSQ